MALIVGIAVGVALVVAVNALAAGLLQSQARALNPLSTIGSNLLVTRDVNQSHLSENDLAALNQETQQSTRASLLDLSKLGPPGTRFSEDFFLPASQLTFSAGNLDGLQKLDDVSEVAGALTLQLIHRDGTVPTIVAQITTQPQTVTITPLTDAERKAVTQCQIATLRAQSPPAGAKSSGIANAVTLTPDQTIACLPNRFRQVAIQQRVITQIVNPPQTDIQSLSFQVTGVDTHHPELGLVTRAQIVSGRYFTATSSNEVVLDTAFAERRNLSLGQTFALRGTVFKVVGLADPPLGGLTSDVYMPLEVLQQLAGRADRINTALLRVRDAAHVGTVTTMVAQSFPGAKALSSREIAATVTGSLLDASHLASTLQLAAVVLVLLATSATAALITLANVRRRIRELGTLRAIGWSRTRVVGQILGESVAQGILAGLLGVALGVAVSLLAVQFAPSLSVASSPSAAIPGNGVSLRTVTRSVHLEAIFAAIPVLLAAGAALLGGLLAGAMGSIRAVRLGPMDALRELG